MKNEKKHVEIATTHENNDRLKKIVLTVKAYIKKAVSLLIFESREYNNPKKNKISSKLQYFKDSRVIHGNTLHSSVNKST